MGSLGRVTSFSAVGVLLFLLLNWCYTTAVFTGPGSPQTSTASGYSQLPTRELNTTSLTVKSTGEKRYCKKCKSIKPDRTHHCSTCGQCVLKMDHHCPWLATCVGLKNYKPFLLFLVYTSIYCWLCFGMTSVWLWGQVFHAGRYDESLTPINYIMLCVMAGIIGLVLTGFTSWHVILALRGQTTIECLEKTRYLSPVRKTMQRRAFAGRPARGEQSYGQQLAEIHANAIPGITRPEEAEAMLHNFDLEHGSNPHQSYDDMERSRERQRYEDYLDEKDSEKLPNAFDLGWKRNLVHLLGEEWYLRCLPICNTTGDGWHWEPNPKWIEAREQIRRSREHQWQGTNHGRESCPYDPMESTHATKQHHFSTNGHSHETSGLAKAAAGAGPGDHDGLFQSFSDDGGSASSRVSLKTLRRKSSFDGDESGEEVDNYYEINSDGSSDFREQTMTSQGIGHPGPQGDRQQRKMD